MNSGIILKYNSQFTQLYEEDIVDNNVVFISWLEHNCPKYKTNAHVSPTAVDKMKLQIGSLPKSQVGSGLGEVEAELENSEMKNKNHHSLS